jgi:hypothetical protein
MEPVNILIAGAVCSLAVLVAVRGVVNGLGQLPKPLSMLLLQSSSLLQEGREILSASVSAYVFASESSRRGLTLAEATLCFNRARRVVIPICMRHGPR